VCEPASQTESDKECEVVCVKLRPKLSLTRECEVVCETASQTESDKGV
jgi:hypothetical protein